MLLLHAVCCLNSIFVHVWIVMLLRHTMVSYAGDDAYDAVLSVWGYIRFYFRHRSHSGFLYAMSGFSWKTRYIYRHKTWSILARPSKQTWTDSKDRRSPISGRWRLVWRRVIGIGVRRYVSKSCLRFLLYIRIWIVDKYELPVLFCASLLYTAVYAIRAIHAPIHANLLIYQK